MLPSEGLKIFSTRLENLYRLAYPHRELDGKDLKRQLLNAIPAASAEMLERDLALVRATTGRQNTWGDVLRLLEIQDESSRRGAVSCRQTNTKLSHSWAGVDERNLAMRVETSSHLRAKAQTPPRSPSLSSRSGSRSPRKRTCNWCKRPGHEYRTCRRRLNQCLRCGSEGHKISDCPKPALNVWRKRRCDRQSNSTSEAESESRKDHSPNNNKVWKKRNHKSTSGKKIGSSSSSDENPLNPNTLV